MATDWARSRLSRRRGGRATLWLLAAAAALAFARRGGLSEGLSFLGPASPAVTTSASEASRTGLAHSLSRRTFSLSPAAGLALWLSAGQPGPAAAVSAATKAARAEVKVAAEALHDLQNRWDELAGKGPVVAGEAVAEVVGANTQKSLEISVPAGESLGVDIEGLSVSAVTRKGLGWQVGDTLEQINGNVVENQQDAAKRAKEAKESNGPIKILIRRLTPSPFVTLEKSMRVVYEASDAPLPEFDDMKSGISMLRSKAKFLIDEIGTTEDLRKSLDSVTTDIDKYANEGTAAVQQKATKTASAEPAGEDLGDLFR